MPNPSSTLATLRPELAASLMEFDLAMDRKGFIGHRVLPVLEVAKQSGPFGRIPIEQLLQNRETKRAPGGGYGRGDWKFEPDSYACEENGWEEPVDDREAQMYAEYFDAEQISAARALDFVLRAAERRVAALIYNTTTWTGAALTTAITHEWDDATNAVPITDVNAARLKGWAGSGLWPNALVINRKQFHNLRTLDQIQDAIASSGAGESIKASKITVAQLAQVFDLDYILVAGSAQNTAKRGQDASLSQVWSDEYAMVCRIAETQDIQEPCLGRTFHWGEDGSEAGGTVESYRDETKRSDIIRVRHDVDEKVLYTQCGHLLSNVTTI